MHTKSLISKLVPVYTGVNATTGENVEGNLIVDCDGGIHIVPSELCISDAHHVIVDASNTTVKKTSLKKDNQRLTASSIVHPTGIYSNTKEKVCGNLVFDDKGVPHIFKVEDTVYENDQLTFMTDEITVIDPDVIWLNNSKE